MAGINEQAFDSFLAGSTGQEQPADDLFSGGSYKLEEDTLDKFLSSAPKTVNTFVADQVQPTSETTIEQIAVPQEPQPGEVDLMLPSADGDMFPTAPVETDTRSRVQRVSDELAMIEELDDSAFDGLGEIMKEDISKRVGQMDQAGFIEKALAEAVDRGTITGKGLARFGTLMEYIGAAGTDGAEWALTKINEMSPTVFNALAETAAIGRYKPAETPAELAETIADMVGATSEFSETLPAVSGIIEPVAASRKLAKGAKQAARQTEKLMEARRNSVGSAELATLERVNEAQELARKTAAENLDISDRMIREFEEKTGRSVSTEVDGRLVIDPQKVRDAGKDVSIDLLGEETAPVFRELAGQGDVIVEPILKPEKYDGIVSIASELKKKNPELWDDNKTVIDNMFDLTVRGDIDGQELIDDLNKYNLSFEDYVLTVVGSGSEAGKVLNKLSQIKRARPEGSRIDLEARKAAENDGAFRRVWMRIENIRRGGMVSQLATASRNLTSAAIRMPLESLGDVMDTTLYKLSNEGIAAAAKAPFQKTTWTDSFANFKYVFSRPDMAKDFTDFILKRSELEDQFNNLFNNINEIHQLTGRGKGGTVDAILSAGEDVVDTLNIPNRWQEHLIRRGTFFAELQRQVRNEYGADLLDLLQQGKLVDLLNDASNVRPQGKASFYDLIDTSVRKAMDVTYAKQPEVPLFRSASSFMVRNGLTVVVPFPRFMFNSMEIMGQYAAGASIPLTRKMASLVTNGKVGGGPLTAKDRQRISRNLVGLATIGAAYQYRTSEEAPAEYNMLNAGEDAVLDTKPLFPAAQYMYLGEAAKRMQDGTFDDWFKGREFVELFTGSNFRTGQGSLILDELAQIADGTDLDAGEQVGRTLGASVGNYLGSWLVPFAQAIDAQRAAGYRTLEYKDVAGPTTLDFTDTFISNATRPLRSRGFGMTAEEEEQLPAREFEFSGTRERVQPLTRLIFGLNLQEKDSEAAEYLTNLGFENYRIASTSKDPAIKRFENATLTEYVPVVVDFAKRREETLRREYANKSRVYKEKYTEEEHVNDNIRPLVKRQIDNLKRKIAEGSIGAADSYTRALLEYRKLPTDLRKNALNYFVQRNGIEPDGTNEEHLRELSIIAQELGKAYK